MDFINPELSCRVFDSHNKKKKQHDYHAFERSLEVGTLAIVLCDKTL